jgi:hypothetical protein
MCPCEPGPASTGAGGGTGAQAATASAAVRIRLLKPVITVSFVARQNAPAAAKLHQRLTFAHEEPILTVPGGVQ